MVVPVVEDVPDEHLIRAIATVVCGEAWLDPRITPEVLDVHRRTAGAARPRQGLV